MKRAFVLVFLLLVAPASVSGIQNSFIAFSYEIETSLFLGGVSVIDGSGNLYTVISVKSEGIILDNSSQIGTGGGYDLIIISFNTFGEIRWSLFFGGSEDDIIHNVEIDSEDNIYLVGDTYSDDFPIFEAFDEQIGGREGFISSFTESGQIRWSSYLGGVDSEFIFGSEIGNSSLLVAGESRSENFILKNPLRDFRNGISDGVISEVSLEGELLWSTYIGDNGTELLHDITLFGDDIFVVGEQFYPDETIPYYEMEDTQAILYKVSRRQSVTQKAINGSGSDYGLRILSDNYGNIYMSGETRSGDIFDIDGQQDIFVARFSNDLERIWSISFGDVKDDFLKDMVLQPDGNILLTAKYTISSKNLTNGYYNQPLGWSDIVLMSINESAQINWASYFGGESFDNPGYLLISEGIIYLSGESQSDDLPNSPGNKKGSFWFLYGIYSPYEDPDNDTLLSIDENRFGTDPGNADTDGDGIDDNVEIENGSDPLVPDTTTANTPLLLSGFVILVVLRRRSIDP